MSGRASDGRTKCNYSIQLWTLVNGDEPLPTAAQSNGLIFFMHKKENTQKPKPYNTCQNYFLLSFKQTQTQLSLQAKASVTQYNFL